jgi:hypothetical protein
MKKFFSLTNEQAKGTILIAVIVASIALISLVF